MQQRLRRQRSQLFAARLTGLPDSQAADLLAALPALETLAEHLTRPAPASAPPKAPQKNPQPARAGR
ncbi:MAG: hypothetical protein JO144_02920 [Actinobacteria bacterium]|nr:hypothetical protein [Actinomycetota bacterium]